jgi:hypothetical protein
MLRTSSCLLKHPVLTRSFSTKLSLDVPRVPFLRISCSKEVEPIIERIDPPAEKSLEAQKKVEVVVKNKKAFRRSHFGVIKDPWPDPSKKV